MKRHLTKLSSLQVTLLISGIISLIFIAISSIGFIFNQPGWMIGVAIGGVVSLASIFLTDIASDSAIKESKVGIYLISYFLRMILFVGCFAFLVICQYKMNFSAFKNSPWGMTIGFFPSLFITVTVQLKYKGGNDGQVH